MGVRDQARQRGEGQSAEERPSPSPHPPAEKVDGADREREPERARQPHRRQPRKRPAEPSLREPRGALLKRWVLVVQAPRRLDLDPAEGRQIASKNPRPPLRIPHPGRGVVRLVIGGTVVVRRDDRRGKDEQKQRRHQPPFQPRDASGIAHLIRLSFHGSTSASVTMPPDIFDFPARRSVKMIGTSTTRPPAAAARTAISIWKP